MNNLVCLVACVLLSVQHSNIQAAEFSTRVEALPFPADAREVEFDATFDDIEFKSNSSLSALVDYYRKEMVKRGWAEDESEADIEDDSAELTFEHGGDSVDVEFDADDEEVTVIMDCEGLDFSSASDPAALIKAGVPQPRSYVFLQEQIPRPAEIQDEEYSSDASHFKSKLGLQEAFDFYGKALKAAGWGETRRPIVTNHRRYTEYVRGADEVSVNMFTHPVGSRIILTYETEAADPKIPPLPEPLAGLAKNSAKQNANQPVRTPVDVAKNTGSATVTLEGKKYTFKHVAAYRTKQNGEDRTQLFFADRPIPLQRIQELLVTEESFGISEIYGDLSWPGHLTIDHGQYVNFSFNSGGIGVGNSIEDPASDIKFEKGRVTGSIKTPEPIEVFDDKMLLEATIDAAVLTPTTILGTEPKNAK